MTITNTTRLYFPTDAEACSERWGANCGPCALAAITRREVQAVRGVVTVCGFDKRPYMNPTHMQNALRLMRVEFEVGKKWPERGLVFIQWGGPWLKPGVPIGAAYRNTHWIAVDGNWVYDVNANHVGHWITRWAWDHPDIGLAAYIARCVPRCDGTWSVRTAIGIPE